MDSLELLEAQYVNRVNTAADFDPDLELAKLLATDPSLWEAL